MAPVFWTQEEKHLRTRLERIVFLLSMENNILWQIFDIADLCSQIAHPSHWIYKHHLYAEATFPEIDESYTIISCQNTADRFVANDKQNNKLMS